MKGFESGGDVRMKTRRVLAVAEESLKRWVLALSYLAAGYPGAFTDNFEIIFTLNSRCNECQLRLLYSS